MISLGAMVAACAPMTPAPTGDSWPAPPQSRPQPTPEPSKPPSPPPKPVEVQKPSAAVQSLLNKGWSKYRQDDYQGALGYAERAQRIDSRSAEVYLLMASAEFSLYRLTVAEQIARKWLSISGSGTSVQRQLQSLLNRFACIVIVSRR